MTPQLLVVEDDRALSGMLEELLTSEGYAVHLARDGQRGLHLALTGSYDAMVIDRGLPAIEGVDLIRRLRGRGIDTPVLILTAMGTVRDRVEGLDAGAEDYLVKPFDVDELLARLRSLRRRHRDGSGALGVPGGRFDPEQRRVTLDEGGAVDLSPRESALLEVLARRPSQVFGREDLLRRVFDEADTTGAVDTYVHYLRRKLGRDVVGTVRGSGYRLVAS